MVDVVPSLLSLPLSVSPSALPGVARAGLVGVPRRGSGLQGRSPERPGRGQPGGATRGEGGHRGTHRLWKVHAVPGPVPYGGAEPGSDSPGRAGRQHCGPGSAQVRAEFLKFEIFIFIFLIIYFNNLSISFIYLGLFISV